MFDVSENLKRIGKYIPEVDDDIVICRCEEVTRGEIRKAIHQGIFTIEEMRRYLRTGMGLCQGQTCERLVKSIMAKELKMSSLEVEAAVSRAPMRPMEMKILGNDGGNL